MLEPEIVMEKSPHPIPTLGRERQLLVVENNEVVKDVLSRMLSFLGYRVTLADNGLEGGTLFLGGSYDLVITGLEVPLMNGRELSRFVKKQSPNTPVIVITELREDKRWEMLNTKFVDAVIPKPFRLNEIEKTVQRLLNSGT